MKKFFTALSIIFLIPGVVGVVMSLFINLYEHEKVIMLVCGILAMVFIIIAEPGILKPKKDSNYNGWLDEYDNNEYYDDYDDDDEDDWEDDDDEYYYYDYDEDDGDEYEDDWEE